MSSRRFSEPPGRWDSWGLLWRVERRLCSPGHALDTTALSKKTCLEHGQAMKRHRNLLNERLWKVLGVLYVGILISFFCDTCIPSYQSDSQNHIRTTRFPSKKQNGMQLPQIGNLIPVFPSQARRFLMLFDGFWLKNSTRMHHEDPWRSMKIHEDPWRVTRLKFLQDSCPTPGLHCIYVAGLRRVTYILEVTGWRPWNMSI